MKKYLLALLLLPCVYLNLSAQVDIVSVSISNSNNDKLTFIQGVTGFENTLTISSVPVNTVEVWLCIVDDQDETLDSVLATDNGSDWEGEVNMGDLDGAAIKIVARCYDPNGDLIEESQPYEFDMISEPASISSGLVKIKATEIDNGTASLEITIHVPDTTSTVDDEVVGLSDKPFGLEYNNIVLQRDFDMASNTLSGDSITYEYQLKAFNRQVAADEIDLGAITNLAVTVDTSFNPIVEGHFSASRNFFEYNFKDATLPLPIKPGSISVGAGLSVDGGFSADCYLGLDNNNEFGFIEGGNGEISNISIGANVSGEVRVTGSLFSKHLAGIQAALRATGRIGASYSFKTKPVFESDLHFGGDLLIQGQVKLIGAVGWLKRKVCGASGWCEANNNILDGVIWPRNNNDQPFNFGSGFPTGLDTLLPPELHIAYDFHSRSLEIDSDDFYDIPDASPQPAFANRGSSVAIAWVEADTLTAHLLLSFLDTVQNRFTNPIDVAQSDVMLAAPRVAIGPDGSAVVVWTQNKLNIAMVDTTYDLDSVFNNLEVWYAVFDPTSGSITTKSKIYALEDLPSSKPGVTISDSGKILISWLAEDTSGSTDIWYSELVNGNGIWYQSTPDIINDLPGNNYNVQICFTDSVNAIAAWITDSDGDDSTGGNQIIASYYDGDSWSPTVAISDEGNEEIYHELSLDFNGDYGAIAYTSTTYTDEGEELNTIKVETYYQGHWDEVNYYEFNDSLSYVRMPKVSISDREFAAISYQTMDMYSENGDADAGEVHVALKDLNAGSNWQVVNFSDEIAHDTSIFVWDMDVVLGRNNTLYTLSQEQDTVSDELYGQHYSPVTGALFGDSEMGLVLRGVEVNDDLTLNADSSINLPEVPTGLQDAVISPKQSLTLLVYPNPFKDNATIEYSIPESGPTRLEVFDLFGRSLGIPVNRFLTPGNYKTAFQTGDMVSGVYVLRLTNGSCSRSSKLIIR